MVVYSLSFFLFAVQYYCVNTRGAFSLWLFGKSHWFSERASLVDSLLPDESGPVSTVPAPFLATGFGFSSPDGKHRTCPTGLSALLALGRRSINLPSIPFYLFFIPGRVTAPQMKPCGDVGLDTPAWISEVFCSATQSTCRISQLYFHVVSFFFN